MGDTHRNRSINDYNLLIKLIKRRRSIRKFKPTPIDNSTIEQIIEAAQWAPSACNKQAWKFIAIRDSNIKDKLVQQCGCPSIFRNAPIVFYVLYDSRFTYAKAANIQSVAAAVQNMLLCAESLGLGATWIAEYGEERRLRKLLCIPKEMMIISAVIMGYPDEAPPTPKRPQPSEVLCYETFDTPPYPLTTKLDDWPLKSIIKLASNSIRLTAPYIESAFKLPSEGQFRREVTLYEEKIKGFRCSHIRVLVLHSLDGNIIMELSKVLGSFEIVDVEFTGQMLNWIKKRCKLFCTPSTSLTYEFVSSALELPFSDNCFDVVVCSTVLNRVPMPLVLIREIKRVAKNSGKLLFSVLNFKSVEGLFRERGSFLLDQFTPVKLYSLQEITNMLEKAGLKLKDVVGVNLFPSASRVKRVTANPVSRLMYSLPTHFFGNLEKYQSRGFLKKRCNLLLFECMK